MQGGFKWHENHSGYEEQVQETNFNWTNLNNNCHYLLNIMGDWKLDGGQPPTHQTSRQTINERVNACCSQGFWPALQSTLHLVSVHLCHCPLHDPYHPHFFFFLINLFFIGVHFANIQNNTQCLSHQDPHFFDEKSKLQRRCGICLNPHN